MNASSINMNLEEKRSYFKQVAFIGVFFFIFGFVTWVNGALIPYLRVACQLEELQSYLVTFAFYISYTVMAIPSGRLIKRKGMLGCMQLGLYIMSFGCLIFVPAALYREYSLFLCGLFIIGTGLTLLQTAVNPFITLLGNPNQATQRISIMGACNKFAGLLAPLVFGALVLNSNSSLMTEIGQLKSDELALKLDQLAMKVMLPYTILAFLLAIISFCLKYSALGKVNITEQQPAMTARNMSQKRYVMQLIGGFAAIFCCVGAEVVAGDTIANYGIFQQISWAIAGKLTSVTLSGMFIGCVAGAILVPKYVKQETAFLFSGLLGIVVVVLIVLLPGKMSVYAVALLGLANALLWPAIWPQALNNLTGARLHMASSLLVMGIAGGAIMPLVYGKVAEFIGNQMGYIVLFPCYLYLISYWFLGKK